MKIKYYNNLASQIRKSTGTVYLSIPSGEVEKIIDVMDRKRIDILGLGETKWRRNDGGGQKGVVVVRDGLKEEVKGIRDINDNKSNSKGRSMECTARGIGGRDTTAVK